MMMLMRGGGAAACPRMARSLRIFLGAAAYPSPEKKSSEDAYYCDAKRGVLALSDGVGGSKTEEVDPGAFSRRLVAHCASAFSADEETTPAGALAHARLKVRSDAVAVRGGSATALLAKVVGDQLQIANFGDCGLVVLRPTPRRFGTQRSDDDEEDDEEKSTAPRYVLWPRVVLRTSEQTHFFNCPYQISAEDAPAPENEEEETPIGASTVDLVSCSIKAGDIVIAATDGLWDNMGDVQVQTSVALRVHALWASAARQGALEPRLELARFSEDALANDPPAEVLAGIAEELSRHAMKIGASEDTPTPFERAAKAEGIAGIVGGKPDDVTVLVGLVVGDEAHFAAVDHVALDNFEQYALDETEP